jgi:hypothetical protein
MKRNSVSGTEWCVRYRVVCQVPSGVFSYLVMRSGDKVLGHLSGVYPVHIVGYSIYICKQRDLTCTVPYVYLL